MRGCLKVLSALLVIYLLLVIVIYLFQRSILYLPNTSRPTLDRAKYQNMHEILLKTSDGLSLLSWYKPALADQPTIIYLQGNAGNISDRLPVVHAYIDKGYGVLLVGYQGYGGNPGKPTERGLKESLRVTWQFLKEQGINDCCIVLFGESLGTALAIELASKQQVGAIILQSPFTSMVDLGYYHYPFLPVGLLLKDRYDVIPKIANVKSPVLFLIAEKDLVVPSKFSKQLYDRIYAPKRYVVYKQANHDDLPNLIQNEVIQFIQNPYF